MTSLQALVFWNMFWHWPNINRDKIWNRTAIYLRCPSSRYLNMKSLNATAVLCRLQADQDLLTTHMGLQRQSGSGNSYQG